jgi:hypothetical protein
LYVTANDARNVQVAIAEYGPNSPVWLLAIRRLAKAFFARDLAPPREALLDETAEAALQAALDEHPHPASEREDLAALEASLGEVLTSAELALVMTLARGDAEEWAEAARLLGKAPGTARTQAHAIRKKPIRERLARA